MDLQDSVIKKQHEETFKFLLRKVQRKGIPEMIEYLEENDFFNAPASSKFHYNFPGGLMLHSLKVFDLFDRMTKHLGLDINQETRHIVPLLHDVCKINMYIKTDMGYKFNLSAPKGHALISLRIIEKFVELLPLEKRMIALHMGMYGASGFHPEYTLNELVEGFRTKEAKLFYFCDDMSAQFMEHERSFSEVKFNLLQNTPSKNRNYPSVKTEEI